ncbi:MAG: YHYH protein, partial [Planctomycetota bacterium]
MPRLRLLSVTGLMIGGAALIAAQPPGGGPPPMRTHTIIQSDGKPDLAPANRQPPGRSRVSITERGEFRIISTAGLPDHAVGQFPNRGNPNRIAAQRKTYRVPLNPTVSDRATDARMAAFGVAINGVEFDPGAGEFYGEGGRQGMRGGRGGGPGFGRPPRGGRGGFGGQQQGPSGFGPPGGGPGGQGGPGDGMWQYEALSGAVPLGLDENHAHVQPGGKYHYHGLPTGLLKNLGWKAGEHSPLIGWAADGFPIYAKTGYTNADDASSPIQELKSSYRLKKGRRPGGAGQPGGTYD